MDRYREDADLFLGGVSMIADDLIRFIKNDLQGFGLGVLFFLVVTLSVILNISRTRFSPRNLLHSLVPIGAMSRFGLTAGRNDFWTNSYCMSKISVSS